MRHPIDKVINVTVAPDGLTMQMEEVKALFIPLRKEHFEAFDSGIKIDEFRPYGPRWNEKTCFPGRPAVISCGYGKRRRKRGIVVKAEIVPPTEAFLKIYGPGKPCYAIRLRDLIPC